jgi:hypothetical protein
MLSSRADPVSVAANAVAERIAERITDVVTSAAVSVAANTAGGIATPAAVNTVVGVKKIETTIAGRRLLGLMGSSGSPEEELTAISQAVALGKAIRDAFAECKSGDWDGIAAVTIRKMKEM